MSKFDDDACWQACRAKGKSARCAILLKVSNAPSTQRDGICALPQGPKKPKLPDLSGPPTYVRGTFASCAAFIVAHCGRLNCCRNQASGNAPLGRPQLQFDRSTT
jgi:hypothetical protein